MLPTPAMPLLLLLLSLLLSAADKASACRREWVRVQLGGGRAPPSEGYCSPSVPTASSIPHRTRWQRVRPLPPSEASPRASSGAQQTAALQLAPRLLLLLPRAGPRDWPAFLAAEDSGAGHDEQRRWDRQK